MPVEVHECTNELVMSLVYYYLNLEGTYFA